MILWLLACTPDEPVLVDADGDGFPAGHQDCDDTDPSVNYLAPERCNGVDDDCDARIDEDAVDGVQRWLDGDGDGVGDLAVWSCGLDPEEVAQGGDCDDTDPDIAPGLPERCNGLDDDCDGVVDEDAPGTVPWYFDDDGDGFGAGDPQLECAVPPDGTAVFGDCDDTDAAVYPEARERLNGDDDDCDGLADDVFLDLTVALPPAWPTLAMRVESGGLELWALTLSHGSGVSETHQFQGALGCELYAVGGPAGVSSCGGTAITAFPEAELTFTLADPDGFCWTWGGNPVAGPCALGAPTTW